MYTIGKYQIDIYHEHTFKEGSADNTYAYDFEYINEDDYLKTVLGIKVFEDENLLNSAIIAASGGATGLYENSVIFEDDRFLLCCSNTVFCLSIPDLSLLWRTKADLITCFQIFKYQDNYIVHGEIEISRLDKNGNIIWQQSGEDIFVVIDDIPKFILEKDYIMVRDFKNKMYKFGYGGSIINDY